MAIKSYKDAGTCDIAESVNTRDARRVLPIELHVAARHRLSTIDAMTTLADLAIFRRWRLEPLKGERAGQHSIRINDQYRICFRWDGVDASEIEITDYH